MTVKFFRADLLSAWAPSVDLLLVPPPPPDPKQFSAVLESTSKCVISRTSSVSLNFAEMGLTPNTPYSFAIPAGFFIDQFGEPSPEQIIAFTSPDLAQVQSMLPAIGQQDTNASNTNNTTIKLYFDRSVVKNIGTITLHYSGGTSVITNDKISVIKNIVTLTVTGLLRENTEFYLTFSQGLFTDVGYNFPNKAVTDNSIKFITANELIFKGLKSSITVDTSILSLATPRYAIRTGADLTTVVGMTISGSVITLDERWLSNATTGTYLEDTSKNITGASLITDLPSNGLGTYAITITVTPSNALKSLTGTYTGGTNLVYNSSTGIATKSGNRVQVNDALNSLVVVPATDFTGTINLSYKLTISSVVKATKSQDITLAAPYDIEITNMGVARSYVANIANNVFSTDTPVITDFDTTSSNVYTCTLSSPIGYFGGQYGGLTNPYVITGSKDYCNYLLSVTKFFPNKGETTNSTFSYTQAKNGVQQINITNIPITNAGSSSITPNVYTFTANGQYSPTNEEVLYGRMDYLMIGGGGAGGGSDDGTEANAGGGGGAGGVIYKTNQLISAVDYAITVGWGGYPKATIAPYGEIPTTIPYIGSDGQNTLFNNDIAYGGQGGQGNNRSWPNSYYRGGATYYATGGNFIGGLGLSEYSAFQGVAGGGGAGATGNGFQGIHTNDISSPAYGYNGGSGGTGYTSNITGTSITYAHGGKGSGTNLYIDNTQYTSYGSGGRGGKVSHTTSGDGAVTQSPGFGIDGVVIIKVYPSV